MGVAIGLFKDAAPTELNVRDAFVRGKPVGKVYTSMLTSKDQGEITFEDIPSPWQILLGRLLATRRKENIPGLATLLFKAIEIANRKRTNNLPASADMLFTPPVQDFNLLSVDQFDQVVEVGYLHAREKIAQHQLTNKL